MSSPFLPDIFLTIALDVPSGALYLLRFDSTAEQAASQRAGPFTSAEDGSEIPASAIIETFNLSDRAVAERLIMDFLILNGIGAEEARRTATRVRQSALEAIFCGPPEDAAKPERTP